MTVRGAIVLLLLTGCIGPFGQTSKRWEPRIGSFTYTQAVEEIGNPDERIVTGSGGWVAIWGSHRERAASLASLKGSNLNPTQDRARPFSGREALRLTFTQEGTLLAWGNH